jgi:ELWxxDGT repeat protein
MKETKRLTRHCIVFIIFGVFWVLWTACGQDQNSPDASSSDTSAISFSLVWSNASSSGEPPAAVASYTSSNICTDFKIDQIKATVYSADDTVMKEGPNWNCEVHQGTLEGLKPQSECKILVEGIRDGLVLWKGQRDNITLVNGEITMIEDPIVMNYIGDEIDPPEIVATSPETLAIVVPLDKVITATFDTDIVPSSITTDTFTLSTGGNPVAGQIAYDEASKTATFTPDNPLTELTQYTASLSMEIVSINNISLTSDYEWTFITLSTRPPEIVATSPEALASAVPVNTKITVTFDTDMAPNSINTDTFTLSSAGNPVAGQIAYDEASKTATFTPDNPLSESTQYTASISREMASISNIPLASDYEWTFVTESTRMIKSFTLGTMKSDPKDLTVIGDTLYFTAEDQGYYPTDSDAGRELFRVVGVQGSPELVKDINPGSGPSGVVNLTAFNGSVYFLADEDPTMDYDYWEFDRTLWQSDGTAEGTSAIDIGSKGGSYAYYLTSSGGALFFRASTESFGNELWKSDGTQEGTNPFVDINPSGDSYPSNLIDVDGTLFFSADDGTNGKELWMSDGTLDGTKMVEDLNASGSSSIYYMTVSGGKLFFRHSVDYNVYTLGVSDGTEDGTFLLQGTASEYIVSLVDGNGMLYFMARDSNDVWALWRSDGTPVGSRIVASLPTFSTYSYPTVTYVDGTLYFSGNGSELWMSNGDPDDPNGTVMLKDLQDDIQEEDLKAIISNMTGAGGTLHFSVDFCWYGDCYYDGMVQTELWKSQGTPDTTLVAATGFKPETVCGYEDCWKVGVDNLAEFNDTLVYAASDGIHGIELWQRDPVQDSNDMVADINTAADGKRPSNLTNVNGTLFFQCCTGTTQSELWKSNLDPDDPQGTLLVRDLTPEGASYQYWFNYMTPFKDLLFFTFNDGEHGSELWSSNGDPNDPNGTKLFLDIHPNGSSNPAHLTVVGSTLFFRATDDTNGTELWKTNGQPGFTTVTKDINPGNANSYPNDLTAVGSLLFFSADDGTNGNELWCNKTDVPWDTDPYLVEDINTAGSSSPDNLTNVNGELYFSATEATHGRELWKSTDGYSQGTDMVKDLTPDTDNSYFYYLTAVNDKVYYRYYNSNDYEYELGVSDGTDGGTKIIDVNPTGSSYPYYLTDVNGTLFFQARDSDYDTELYAANNSTVFRVKDINASGSSYPSNLVNVGGKLYFSADDGINGKELWQSDGTANGTDLVLDINPGIGASTPTELIDVDGVLVFLAYDAVNGFALWKHVPH